MKAQGSTNHMHGLVSEDAAARAYEEKGGKIVARRARTAAGEIDLIIDFGNTTVFAEVKASKSLETAARSLSQKQIQRIGTSAEIWLAENNYPAMQNMRFDLVISDRNAGFEIIENAISFDI